MRLPLLHPSLGSLKRFADGEETADRRQVADHIATCSECRDQVASLRSLSQTARGLGEMDVPSTLIDSVRTRVAAGEQVILPLTDSGTKPVRSRWAYAAAAAIVAISVGAWLFWPSPDLSAAATSGTLSLTPGHPTPGAWISVEYQPPQALAGSKSLILRARFRTDRDEGYEWTTRQVVAATLRPTGKDRFEGRFKLPDNAVYAAFAVEAPDGHYVDSNDHRLWEVLICTSDGRPLLAAFAEQARDLQGRNWPEALEVARRLVQTYPQSPYAWDLLHFYEMVNLGHAHNESTATADLARLRAFHARYARSVDPEIIAGMLDYAVQFDDTTISRYWRSKVLLDTSSTFPMLEDHVGQVLFTRNATGVLAAGDSIWRRYHPILPGMFEQNMVVKAQQAKDTAALLRWVIRLGDVWPTSAAWADGELTKYPSLRDTGFVLLRGSIKRLSAGDDSLRPLELTREEQQHAMMADVRRALVSLGNALIATGDTLAGADTLRLAGAAGWDPRLFRQVAAQFLALHDTASAAKLLALSAADPGTSFAAADSLRAQLGAYAPPSRWSDMLDSAGLEMRRRLIADAVYKPLRPSIRVTAPDGKVVNLADVLHGNTSFVVFWSRECGFAVQAMPEIDRVKDVIRSMNAQTVIVTDEADSPELRKYLEDHSFTAPVYHDTRAEAGTAFQQDGWPYYFVVDAEGAVRFAYTQLERVPAEVAALQPGPVKVRTVTP
jgi:hypothetical protein